MSQSQSFEARRLFHRQQVAIGEVAMASAKFNKQGAILSSKWRDVGHLQAEYDDAVKSDKEAWDAYNAIQLEYKDIIAIKIREISECNIEEERFRKAAKAHPDIKDLYMEAAEFFARLAREKLVERDDLIEDKRQVPRPVNRAPQILERLKMARLEHKEMREKYHELKNEFNIKKQHLENVRERYKSLVTGQDPVSNSNYTSCPKRLVVDEKLLEDAGVPKDFWDDVDVKQRADGIIDIYYAISSGEKHGHVILDASHVITFHRAP